MEKHRAEAVHNGHPSLWRGKWRKDRQDAIEQAKRWRKREPLAVISIVSTNGMRATLEEMDTARLSKEIP